MNQIVIIGGGIIGLSIGIALLESSPNKKVFVYEKELTLGAHASGRNSGVLHAGFYYSPDSLKAKFCADGNKELKAFCNLHSLPLKEIGKVVVTANFQETERLRDLYQRGLDNKIELELLDESKLRKIEPAAKTYGEFLWSPTTAISDPRAVVSQLVTNFNRLGGRIIYGKEIALTYVGKEVVPNVDGVGVTNSFVVNAAGVHSLSLARGIGVGLEYMCLPFLGVYRSSKPNTQSPKTLIYPVPHPINPFLGAHITLNINGDVKIGPTAFPVIGLEQYSLISKISFSEVSSMLLSLRALVKSNEYDLSEILKKEFPKLFTKLLLKDIKKFVPSIDNGQEWNSLPPGIRAQLVNLESGNLEQDFIVKREVNSLHILNAVSPGWTSALPFGRWIADSITV